MENVTVNKLELASELAHQKLVDRWDYKNGRIFKDDGEIVEDYTDTAQDMFNEYYDEYLTMIENILID